MQKIDLVNSKIGTDNCARFSNGNILPLVAAPHGMTGFCPQTDASKGNWFFNPRDTSFEGIRLTHQPSPWVGDYGHILFLPTSGDILTDDWAKWSSFRHNEAFYSPYYNKFNLLRYEIDFEISATERGGIFRIKFNKPGKNRFYIFNYDKNSKIELDNNIISGYTNAQSIWKMDNITEYFTLHFDCNVKEFEVVENGAYVEFEENCVTIKLATSFISTIQAEINYSRELESFSFDEIKENLKNDWEHQLNKIDVSLENLERAKTFYSCMYRALLFPRKFYELDKNNQAIHKTESGEIKSGVMYTDNGFWDTYRTVYPLLSIIDKQIYAEMIDGFVNYADDTGYLPKWLSPYEFGLMPGTLIEAVIADAVVKDIIDMPLAKKALKYMLKNALQPSGNEKQGRHGCAEYNKYGYLPRHNRECVNHTLDCAYGDFCIAQVANKLGENDIAKQFYARSQNFKNIFDKTTGFMRGKDEFGKMKETFNPYDWGGENCEGSSWQNSFAVYHDIAGLADLYGGKDKLIAKLDELFGAKPVFNVGEYKMEIHEMSEMAAIDFGQCAISNQPSFHLPYLYAILGAQEKTNYWVERLVNEAFSSSDSGFPGDEDNGTMAAWYIFSCLGYYPLCPGKNEYVNSKPLFSKIKFNIEPCDQ